MKLLLVLIGIFTLLNKSEQRSLVKRETGDKRVVCYYTNWSAYRPETVRFTRKNIDPHLCTHLLYAFGKPDVDTNSIVSVDVYQDYAKGGYREFNELKEKNPKLKTMISVGGWNEGSTRFSQIVSNSTSRAEFVNNSIAFVRSEHFDGIDLVWQYPTFREGSSPADKQNYADLIKEMREAFEKEANESNNARLLLSVVVSGLSEYIEQGFDKDTINKYADFINVIAYDYYVASGPVVNHHSSLYPTEEESDNPIASQLNVDASINSLLRKGYLPEMINLGIPTYGRLFTLEDPEINDVGSSSVGGGMGNTTSEAGYMPYYELCADIKKGGWTLKNQNASTLGPYAYKGNLWVGYEDKASAKKKGEYAKSKGLGGVMFWTIDDDDFLGRCHEESNPIIKAAKKGISGS